MFLLAILAMTLINYVHPSSSNRDQVNLINNQELSNSFMEVWKGDSTQRWAFGKIFPDNLANLKEIQNALVSQGKKIKEMAEEIVIKPADFNTEKKNTVKEDLLKEWNGT